MAKVESFKFIQNVPKIPEVQHLLPKSIFTSECELVISGINNAVANGLRRTICMELPVKAMLVLEEIETNDDFIIPEMIVERIKMIPILQSTPVNAVFSLSATNMTGRIRDVYSGEIKGKGALPFDENFPLFTLRPGTSISIPKIGIMSEIGYMPGCGMCAIASSCVSVALDVEPLNLYTGVGVSTTVADPRKWRIAFTSHGTMGEVEIITTACANIIARITAAKERLPTIKSNGREHALAIEGETDTLGNLFMKTVLDIHPAGVSILYDTDKIMHSVVIKMICDGDAATILEAAADEIIETYKIIAAGAKKLAKKQE